MTGIVEGSANPQLPQQPQRISNGASWLLTVSMLLTFLLEVLPLEWDLYHGFSVSRNWVAMLLTKLIALTLILTPFFFGLRLSGRRVWFQSPRAWFVVIVVGLQVIPFAMILALIFTGPPRTG